VFDTISTRFACIAPALDFWALRLVDESHERICVRQDVLQPIANSRTIGALITVIDRGGIGYAATTDLSPSGLKTMANQAQHWARRTANRGLIPVSLLPRSTYRGGYRSCVEQPWNSFSLTDKIELLRKLNGQLKTHERIVDWQASLTCRHTKVLLTNSDGGFIEQEFHYILPALSAVANDGNNTQRRSYGGSDIGRQGGLEQLDRLDFLAQANRVAEEALMLLQAPMCPAKTADLLLMPSQMVLQIHESIGHPLELDRILGDERNYAGGSFVTLDMFGSYQYGSKCLNVTFDPTRAEQLASYAFDDEGFPASREHIIRNGILQRPLGGATSQARSGLPGVANSRAAQWNRAPIDRMANLNLEPGDRSLSMLIESIDDGILMDTNQSWSIDDSRNKFQFGCEYGQLIQEGRLAQIVRNPNYRGISATFWRSLSEVGDTSTLRLLGTLNCGKGEPNQLISVGHASPACVFRAIDVFGAI
jgi:predicted Zn-dependent protease